MKVLYRSEGGYLLVHTLILALILTLLALSLAGVWHWRLNLQSLFEQHLEIETLMVSGIAMAHLMMEISGDKNDLWLELPPPDIRILIIKFDSQYDNSFQVLLKSEGNLLDSYSYNY